MNFPVIQKILLSLTLATAVAVPNGLKQLSQEFLNQHQDVSTSYQVAPPTPNIRTHMRSMDQVTFDESAQDTPAGEFPRSRIIVSDLTGEGRIRAQLSTLLSQGSPHHESLIPKEQVSALRTLLSPSSGQNPAFGPIFSLSPSQSPVLQLPIHRPALSDSNAPGLTVKIQLPGLAGQAPREETLFFGNIRCQSESCSKETGGKNVHGKFNTNKPSTDISSTPGIIPASWTPPPFVTKITFPDSKINITLSDNSLPGIGQIRFPSDSILSKAAPGFQTPGPIFNTPRGGDTVPIIQFREQIRQGESHSISFTSGNGIHQKEVTYFQRMGNNFGSGSGNRDNAGGIVKTGEYSYTAPNGQIIRLSYIADKDGFRPQGDHLPTPPPVLVNAYTY